MTTRTWSMRGITGAVAIAGAALLGPKTSDPCCPARAEASPANEPAASTKVVTLNIEGMTCASCNLTVRMPSPSPRASSPRCPSPGA